MQKIELALAKVETALIALEKSCLAPIDKERFVIDSAIQRFEFTFELFWKTLKIILNSQGVDAQFPKVVLLEAYQGKLINDEPVWLCMLKDRNLSSHSYNKDLADEIYTRIKTYVPVLKTTLAHLKTVKS